MMQLMILPCPCGPLDACSGSGHSICLRTCWCCAGARERAYLAMSQSGMHVEAAGGGDSVLTLHPQQAGIYPSLGTPALLTAVPGALPQALWLSHAHKHNQGCLYVWAWTALGIKLCCRHYCLADLGWSPPLPIPPQAYPPAWCHWQRPSAHQVSACQQAAPPQQQAYCQQEPRQRLCQQHPQPASPAALQQHPQQLPPWWARWWACPWHPSVYAGAPSSLPAGPPCQQATLASCLAAPPPRPPACSSATCQR
jgi:hypothetical protein